MILRSLLIVATPYPLYMQRGSFREDSEHY